MYGAETVPQQKLFQTICTLYGLTSEMKTGQRETETNELNPHITLSFPKLQCGTNSDECNISKCLEYGMIS